MWWYNNLTFYPLTRIDRRTAPAVWLSKVIDWEKWDSTILHFRLSSISSMIVVHRYTRRMSSKLLTVISALSAQCQRFQHMHALVKPRSLQTTNRSFIYLEPHSHYNTCHYMHYILHVHVTKWIFVVVLHLHHNLARNDSPSSRFDR